MIFLKHFFSCQQLKSRCKNVDPEGQAGINDNIKNWLKNFKKGMARKNLQINRRKN